MSGSALHSPHQSHRITLVGMRACGKSTLGRLVASRLAWPFLDADHELEMRLGKPIPQVFKEHGELFFRDAEEAVLAELLAHTAPMVLATGGGAILRPDTRERLRRRGGLVVYLEAPVPVIQERLRRHDGGRPSLLGAGHPADEIPALHALRDPLYREVASAIVPSVPGAGGPALVADRIVALLQPTGDKTFR